MEIGQLIQTFIASIIGGCFVIVANWIIKRWGEKEAAKAWYENIYINEAIEPLIAYFIHLDIHFRQYKNRDKEKMKPILPKNIEPIPINALARIEALLDSYSLIQLIELVLVTIKGDREDYITASILALTKTNEILKEMRQEINQIISTKVKNKRYHMNLSQFQHKFDNLLDEVLEEITKYAQFARSWELVEALQKVPKGNEQLIKEIAIKHHRKYYPDDDVFEKYYDKFMALQSDEKVFAEFLEGLKKLKPNNEQWIKSIESMQEYQSYKKGSQI